MFLTSMFIVLLIPLVILFTCGVPLLIGIFVYRDAKKRVDCSPWLWAIVSALAPSFVGVIIYLVVRNDYPLKSGQSRMNGAEAGSSEEDSSYYEREYDQKAVDAKSGLPTWAKALIIIVAVVIGVCILAGIGSAIYGVFHYNSQPSIYHYGF